MGYSTEQFLSNNLNDEFICAICQDVLQNVVMAKPCEHVFCKRCINQWKQTSNTCPVDRREIKRIKSPPRFFINLINALEKFCEFSAAGCRDVIKLGNIKSHNDQCDFNPANNNPCHKGCGAIVKLCHISTHNCINYLKEEVRKKTEEFEEFKRLTAEAAAAATAITTNAPMTPQSPSSSTTDHNNRNNIPVQPSTSLVVPVLVLATPTDYLSQYLPTISYTNRQNITDEECNSLIRIVLEELKKDFTIVFRMDQPFQVPFFCCEILSKLDSQLGGTWGIHMFKVTDTDRCQHGGGPSSSTSTSGSGGQDHSYHQQYHRIELRVDDVTFFIWKC